MENRRSFPAFILFVVVLLIAFSLFALPNLKPQEENKTFTNSIGTEFVLIHPGSFMMGSQPGEQGRDPNETLHKVTISRPFYMQISEVTQAQWVAVMGTKSDPFARCGDDCPAGSVSWEQAIEFVQKLNKKEESNKYRLPTEAEWEYACRAGTETAYNWGDIVDCSKANYGNFFSNECYEVNPEASVKTRSFQPNHWGLYDMHGNIGEWCQDIYGDYPEGHVTDPNGLAKGESRVIRGGSWGFGSEEMRSAARLEFPPDERYAYFGFRLVMETE